MSFSPMRSLMKTRGCFAILVGREHSKLASMPSEKPCEASGQNLKTIYAL